MKATATILILLIAGCAGAASDLSSCVAEQNSYGPDFLDALISIEAEMITRGHLADASIGSYSAFAQSIESGSATDELVAACQADSHCWLLTAPASIASYIVCPQQITGSPLNEVATRAETNGDIGPEYVRHILASLDEKEFEEPIYRGAVLNALLVGAEQSLDGRE
jgi:hypothetical protein